MRIATAGARGKNISGPATVQLSAPTKTMTPAHPKQQKHCLGVTVLDIATNRQRRNDKPADHQNRQLNKANPTNMAAVNNRELPDMRL